MEKQKTGLHQGLGIGSLVVGIIALLISFIPCLGQFAIFVAPIAILMGLGGYYLAKSTDQSSGLNLGGVIISLIAFYVAWWQMTSLNDATNYMNKSMGGKGVNSIGYLQIILTVVVIGIIVFINYTTGKKKNIQPIIGSNSDTNPTENSAETVTSLTSNNSAATSTPIGFDLQDFFQKNLKSIIVAFIAIIIGFGVWHFFIKIDPIADGKNAGTLYCDCRKEEAENIKKEMEKFISEFTTYNFKTQQDGKDQLDKIKSEVNKTTRGCFDNVEEKIGKLRLSYLNDASKMSLFEQALTTINQSCNDEQNDVINSELNQKADSLISTLPMYEAGKAPSLSDLPFTGKKYYSTHPMMSGSGTPQYFVEIREDGDVYFGYDAPNMNGPAEHKIVNAGKFQQVIECKNSDCATGRFFSITAKQISVTDKNGELIFSPDCCGMNDPEPETEGDRALCPCDSEYW